jgi:protein-tyrosine phosphatase
MYAADIHFHLLPGVDDGPSDLGESIELARAAVAAGTGTVVVTPHVRRDFVTEPLELPARVAELRAALAKENIPLDLHCGGELGHDLVGLLAQPELVAIAQGPAGGRWLLVETPFEGFTESFHEATGELRDRGFGVVIAHPERTADAATEGAAALRRELAQGSVAQVNAQSLTGRHGEEALHAAHALVQAGMVALVASDAHGPARPPSLRPAFAALLHGGAEPRVASRLVRERPWQLLARGLAEHAAVAA